MKRHMDEWLQPGDTVETHKGERGVISRPFENEGYDWWVEIDFVDDGTEFSTLEPYRETELTWIVPPEAVKQLENLPVHKTPPKRDDSVVLSQVSTEAILENLRTCATTQNEGYIKLRYTPIDQPSGSQSTK